MADVWSQEAEKHSPNQQYSDIREFRFDNNHEHTLRLIPQKDPKKLPFHGYIIHWVPQQNSKKGRPIVHAIDKRCILCEYVSDLWTEINRLKEEEDCTDKSPNVQKIYALIQGISGKKKYDFNILDREDLKHEVNGKKVVAPKRFTTPSTVWKPIFEYAKNPKWGSPSDEKNGYDLQ